MTAKWNTIIDHWTREYYKDRKQKMDYFESALTGDQKRRIDLLVKIVADMGLTEQRLLAEILEKNLHISSQPIQASIMQDLPDFMTPAKGTWPKENKNWFQQFGAFTGSGVTGGSPNSSSDPGSDDSAIAQEAPVDDAPKERTSWDLVLTSFDAKKKIAIIKEVKNVLGLGLKESKELVESAPAVLKAGVPTEEAERL